MSKKLLFWGGGVLALFFVSQNLSAYDQVNTHPALTKATGDFYNLNFPQNKINEEEIRLMMKGAVEEDTPPRWLNHSYDPVHNKAWIGYRTSKVWAMSSASQQRDSNVWYATAGFLATQLREDHPQDFSYERALLDYAKGNRTRAFEALGHVMHLLEDANVPEHTRLDIHLPWHGTESPYEMTMAKWNPNNIDVAQKLYQQREKPILLNNLNNYFDEIAGYSNNYFFSEDTINDKRYVLPKIKKIEEVKVGSRFWSFGIGLDKNGQEFKLALLDVRQSRNLFEIKNATLTNETINTLILDDYWSRLSKDFILHAAGVVKMFLEQGEEAKKEYQRQQALKEQNKKGFLASLLGLGKDKNSEGIPLIQTVLREIEDKKAAETEQEKAAVVAIVAPSAANEVLPITPASDFSLPSPAITTSVSPAPSLEPAKAEEKMFAKSGGGESQATAIQTPTPTSTPTPTPIPTPTPSATPTPEAPRRQAVINEIAWMGTASSSSDEWMELYNTSSQSLNVGGWTLTAQSGSPAITLASKSISPFSFYLLERTNDSTISDITADQIYTGALNNSGEILTLKDASGNLQDVVSKSASGWYAGSNSSKSSMERIDPLKAGDDSANWGTNNGITKNDKDAGDNNIKGTPRAKNSIFSGQKPSKINNLAISSASDNKINFSWGAPLDKDTLPANLQYNFHYATKSFDLLTDWDSAKIASGLSAVGNFGQTASYSLTISGFNKTYYFTLKTKDADNNFSDISNQISYLLPGAVSSVSWAMSGFDAKHGLKTSFLGPVASSSASKWGIQLLSSPTYVFNQPVVAPSGVIYFGASNGSVTQLRAVTPSGSNKWQYSGTNGASIGTPVALSDGSVLFGYDSNGSELTRVSDSGSAKYANAIGTIKSIITDQNGVAYFTSSADKLMAVLPNGTQKWLVYKDGISGFTPMVFQDKIYLTARVSGVPNFYAFDAKDGSFLWSKTMSTGSPSCCGVSDISYDSASDFLYAGANQYILKIDRNGNTLEQFTADRQNGWGYTTTMISPDSANLIFGLDFSVSNPASKSAIYAVNKSTKEASWKYPVDNKINKQIALDSGGNVYFSTKNGWVYSLNPNGSLNWKIDLGSTTSAYPVIGPRVLYITLDSARVVKIGE